MTLIVSGYYASGNSYYGNNVDQLLSTLNVTLGKKYFISWFTRLYSAYATRLDRTKISIEGAIDNRFTVAHRRSAVISGYHVHSGQGVFDINSVQAVSLYGEDVGSGNVNYANLRGITAIELNQFIENTDYFYAENNVAKVDMDNVYSNNVGPSITFTPDGTSNYAVFGFGVVDNPSGNTKGNYGGMRMRDITASQTLSECKRDVYNDSADPDIAHPLNGMWILEAPAAVSKTVRLEFIGAGVWDHRYSNIFILRLEAFGNSSYAQGNPEVVYSDTSTHSLDSYTIPIGYAVFGRVEASIDDSSQSWGMSLYKTSFPSASAVSNMYLSPYTDAPSPGGVPDGSVGHRYYPYNNNMDIRVDSSQATPYTVHKYCGLSVDNTSYLEYYPPEVTNQNPASGETGVGINKPIKFRLASNPFAGVDPSTIDVAINRGSGFESAINGGIFQAGFDGPGASLSPLGDGSGYDVTIVPLVELPTSQLVSVRVDADNDSHGNSMTQVNYSFTTSEFTFSFKFTPQTFQLIFPDEYTEDLDLSSIPSGYTAQTSGTGTAPTFDLSGMTTSPGAAGASFVKKSAAGLDFDVGVLFDVVVSLPPLATPGKVTVLRLSKAEQGVISVGVDFALKEVWLDSISNPVQSGFRPGVKGDSLFFRLSVKGSGDNLIARLYSSKEDFVDPPLLKQTGGPSTLIPIAIDTIEFGSILGGDAPILVKSLKMILDEDPDAYYPFPQVSNLTPTADVLDGGRTMKLEFASEIDIDAGSSLLFSDDEFNDESTGSANTDIAFGVMTLSVSGIGKAMLRGLRSYSGDLPSGADISSIINVSSSLLTKPPQTEVILAGVEMMSNGNTLAIEYVADSINRAFFRVKSTSGGITVLNKKILNAQKSSFTMRIIRAGNKIKMLIDGITLISTSLKDGPGIIRYYAEAQEAVVFDTTITSIVVRPVVVIGDSIANV